MQRTGTSDHPTLARHGRLGLTLGRGHAEPLLAEARRQDLTPAATVALMIDLWPQLIESLECLLAWGYHPGAIKDSYYTEDLRRAESRLKLAGRRPEKQP